MTELPDAEYLLLSSRLIPGLDGGFTVAALARGRLLEDAGVAPLLLTLDPGTPEDHAAHRRDFVARGDARSLDAFRNLFDDAVADPAWLRAAATPGQAVPGVEYRDIPGADGATLLSLPVVRDPDWHLTEAPIVVPGAGVIAGWRGLYRAWLEHVVRGLRERADDQTRLIVVVIEARQLGELLAGWDDPDVRLVHTVHNSHLPAPYDDPDAAIGGLWGRWLSQADRFDAVLWPTAAQRDEVVARFGDPGTFAVVPNGIALGAEPPDAASRDAHLAVMVNRLAPQKRVDVAIRAWQRVVREVPGARLEIYGDGPLRTELQRLVDDLGLASSVTLRGATRERDAILDTAAVFISTSDFEGQGLSIAEALARGVAVVATDARYGPRETIGDAGVVVPVGDADAVAAAVIALLQNEPRRAQLATAARAAARALGADAVRPALVAALAAAASRPSRRTGS
ncbi:glycosyltransferase [Microbacter sp. GSS18]|nr:glycosyltransferase [Microbacter sp. GSS18]